MSLIGRDELRRRIFEEDTILTAEWASEECLRAGGYDLRIAGDRLTLNGEERATPTSALQFIGVDPGDVVSVATYERFRMPWAVAANIGVRFHFARRGLLVFTGLLVDPGFGLEPDGGNGWQPKADERLEFFIANLGAERVEIRLGASGDRVLSLQFLSVEEPTEKRPVTAPETGLSTQALSVFGDVRRLEASLTDERTERREDAERFDIQLRGVRGATEQVVVFGVFLVAVSVIGVTLTTLLEGLASSKMDTIITNLNNLHISGTGPVLICLAALLLATAITIGTIYVVVRAFVALWQARVGQAR